MKHRLLVIVLFFWASFFSFAQSNTLEDSPSNDVDFKFTDSRGSLFVQIEFSVPSNGTIGLSYDGEYFYITRHSAASIYKFDAEGNQIGDSFSIEGITTGLTTLVYDGRYFWGAMQSTTIHKIDMQADPPARVDFITAPIKVLHCTFDPDADNGNGGLWIGDFNTDLVLIDLSGAELTRIAAATHGLSNTIGTALDTVTPGGPFIWAINSVQSQPPIMRQIKLPEGTQTGKVFNLYNEGLTGSGDSGGGMLVLSDFFPETTTLFALIQNSKVFGFNVEAFIDQQFDIGVSSLDMPYSIPNTDEYSVKGIVKNYGTETITSFQINYQIDDEEIKSHIVSDVSLATGAQYSFTHPVKVTPVLGSHAISVWTALPNGEDDEFTANDKKDFSYLVYDEGNTRPRIILLESFTSSTCGPCVAGNNNLKNVMSQNRGLFALIKYQMNWPGNGDPYYTEEGGVRCGYYGVGGVPWLQLEGTTDLNTGSLNNNQMVNRQSIPAILDIDIEYSVSEKTVNATATVNSTINLDDPDLRLFMVILETITKNNTGSNGEKEFHQVMKKFMPDAKGIELEQLTANTPLEFEQEWEFKGEYRKPQNANSPINHSIEHSVENFDNLTVMAWIQNVKNKTVLQSVTSVYPVYFSKVTNSNGTVSAKVNETEISTGMFIEVGSEVTFSATPNPWNVIKEWKLNGEIIEDYVENELNYVIENHSVNAIVDFYTTHFNVKFNTVNNFGTVSATIEDEEISSDQFYERGSQIVFTAHPNDGYEVKTWRNNNVIITGNTSNEYILTSLQNSANVTVEFQPKVGIDKQTLSNIGLYPNPFSTNITITNVENVKDITISNILGQTVMEVPIKGKTEKTIDTKSLSPGIYILILQDENGEKTMYQIVKQ